MPPRTCMLSAFTLSTGLAIGAAAHYGLQQRLGYHVQ